MSTSIWLTYDLGVGGDYTSLYSWLSNHGAQEYGTNVAFPRDYEHKGDLLEFLEKDIAGAVDLDRRSRIYVLFRKDDGRNQGKFLFGRRKSPPWTGYGDSGEEEFDEAS